MQFPENTANSSDIKEPTVSEENNVDEQQENGVSHHGKSKFGLQRTSGLTGAISFNLGTMIGKKKLHTLLFILLL